MGGSSNISQNNYYTMNKLVTILVLIFSSVQNADAQSWSDSVLTRQTLGRRFVWHGEILKTMHEVKLVTKTNLVARRMMKTAMIDRFVGTITLVGGLASFASGAVNESGGLVGLGIGLMVLSLPFNLDAHSLQKRAINAYNEGLHKTGSLTRRPQYYLSLNRQGLGLRVNF